jgi:hypothetical protein
MFIRMNKSRSHSESATRQRESQKCRRRRPSYSSTLRIGFENKRILKDIRVGHLDVYIIFQACARALYMVPPVTHSASNPVSSCLHIVNYIAFTTIVLFWRFLRGLHAIRSLWYTSLLRGFYVKPINKSRILAKVKTNISQVIPNTDSHQCV